MKASIRLAALALALATPAALSAQDGPQPGATPDFSGLWVISQRSSPRNNDENFVELKPEDYLNEKGLEAIAVVRPALDPGSQCLPSRPRHLSYPYPMEIVQTHNRMVNLFEADTVFRIVYLDGREHPDPDADTRFMGHAVGHWEGDTLVVESANFNGKAWLEASGIPQSEQSRLTENYSLVDDGETLQIIARYEDPEYLTRPVWRRYLYNRRSDWEISEYICAEGNRDNAFQPREGQPGALEIDDVIIRDGGK
ncbi:MAG TPA: hypothetical protein VLA37_08560 [Sphingomonadaceae bacterium]|nr:hypothetical protein [Sphingomonadaceae bacterium]